MSSTSDLPFPLVQATWQKAMALGEGEKGFGYNFYKNLFEKHPSLLETIFKGVSIENQRKNLPKSITTVLSLLTDMPKAIDALQQLGARHVLYGTPDAGYAVVGENVIFTLQMILGDEFTPAAKEEWVTIYRFISKTMIDAAHSDKAAVWWQRLHVKRAKELQGIIAASGVSSAALSKQVGSKADLAAVAAAIADTKQVAGPTATFAAGMSADNLKNLAGNLSAALGGAKTLNPYDEMVIAWFATAVQENAGASASASSASGSCCGASTSSLLAGGAVVAALVAGAFFFLKKKQ